MRAEGIEARNWTVSATSSRLLHFDSRKGNCVRFLAVVLLFCLEMYDVIVPSKSQQKAACIYVG